MRQHLLADPDVEPAAVEAIEAGWLRLSARLTARSAAWPTGTTGTT